MLNLKILIGSSILLGAFLLLKRRQASKQLKAFQADITGPGHDTSGDANHNPIQSQYLDYQLEHFHIWK